MTIRTAKIKTEMLNSLLITFSDIIEPYCISKEQTEVMKNFRIEMLAIADAEISYAENMKRIEEGLTWDEYNQKYNEKTNNNPVASDSEGNKSAGPDSGSPQDSERGNRKGIFYSGIKGIFGIRSGRN